MAPEFEASSARCRPPWSRTDKSETYVGGTNGEFGRAALRRAVRYNRDCQRARWPRPRSDAAEPCRRDRPHDGAAVTAHRGTAACALNAVKCPATSSDDTHYLDKQGSENDATRSRDAVK